MTPKEKAKELVDKFFEYTYRVKWDIDKNKWEHNFDQSKQCALIAVDEILNNWKDEASIQFPYGKVITYWNIVKEEIEEL
jgi:hypothetical protein